MATPPPPSSQGSRLRRAASAAALQQQGDRFPSQAKSDTLPRQRRPRTSKQTSTPEHLRQDSHPFPSLYTPTKPYRSTARPSTSSSVPTHFNVPPLRYSGSSSQTHYDSPLATPVDNSFSTQTAFEYPAVVEVGTMDALVDGLNQMGTAASGNRFDSVLNHAHPPLPTPPPGVVLGRRKKTRSQHSDSSNSGDDEEAELAAIQSADRSRRKRMQRRGVLRAEQRDSTSQPTAISAPTASTHATSRFQNTSPATTPRVSATRSGSQPAPSRSRSATNLSSLSNNSLERYKSVNPSISEIIRNHSNPPSRNGSRYSIERSASLYSLDYSVHCPVAEEPDPIEEEDIISRSSMDSVTEEVQRTLRNQNSFRVDPPLSLGFSSSFAQRHSGISGGSLPSPLSDGTSASNFASSYRSYPEPPSPGLPVIPPPTASEAIARYLRSSRLTTLLKLTRSPHASPDNPLTVSLSDLGQADGFPLVVFLGLGCVRHIMGLYDEMANILGLRVIAIDRWGLGRTEPRSKSAKGITQWGAVVQEVLDLLEISRCSVMAHSAGAPYALSFANRSPERIVGDVCLLAPWVGGRDGAGTYKWLKYVPNGILKTAQAAEWKLQTWMIGRPPTLSYQGIGYTVTRPPITKRATNPPSSSNVSRAPGVVYPSSMADGKRRPSIASSSFSEYDDLRDFNGRFDSRSTVGGSGTTSPPPDPQLMKGNSRLHVTRKKSTKGLLNMLKGGGAAPEQGSRKLKSLKSVSSLRSKSGASSPGTATSSPQLPPPAFEPSDLSLDFDVYKARTDAEFAPAKTSQFGDNLSLASISTNSRANGKRSISLHHSSPRPSLHHPSPQPSLPPSPRSTDSIGPSITTSSEYQASLGNALIAASHAESAKGTHNDLLQILNHENHSWGFSYSAYPHKVKVWYGEKDEKIAENAVRWMQKTMGEDQCSVQVVRGADHSLMYKSSVVVDVLERVADYWRDEMHLGSLSSAVP